MKQVMRIIMFIVLLFASDIVAQLLTQKLAG